MKIINKEQVKKILDGQYERCLSAIIKNMENGIKELEDYKGNDLDIRTEITIGHSMESTLFHEWYSGYYNKDAMIEDSDKIPLDRLFWPESPIIGAEKNDRSVRKTETKEGELSDSFKKWQQIDSISDTRQKLYDNSVLAESEKNNRRIQYGDNDNIPITSLDESGIKDLEPVTAPTKDEIISDIYCVLKRELNDIQGDSRIPIQQYTQLAKRHVVIIEYLQEHLK